MILAQELNERGDEITLTNHFNTDDIEKENWQKVQQGKGFIKENGKIVAREIAQIPIEEAAMLESMYDLDYLAFSHNNDRAALRRLLQRFPHWKCCSGGV
ncbi:MAG: hypothetical protein IJP96_03230 [Synergistaceae bacterium]|nr:hypothetical protein [Synergistaceae bacterium]MBR0251956.1 hypothetical protein [Synergistaceae bacterium]